VSTVGARRLEPETAINYETGILQSLGTWGDVRLSYFLYDIDDYIATSSWNVANIPGATGLYTYNLDNVKIQGFEVEGNFSLTSNLSGYANYLYQDNDTSGEMPSTPPNFLALFAENQFNLGVRYKAFEAYKFLRDMLLHADIRYVGTRESKAGFTVDDFTVVNVGFEVDLGLGSRVAQELHPKLSFWINNLFDEDYEEVYGFPMPGVNVGGGIKLTLW
jgi:outer membrane receptor protein involved in Fe transport